MILTNRFLMMAVLITVNTFPPVLAAPTDSAAATYVGSAKWQECPAGIYGRWTKTRMANVVTDPNLHGEMGQGHAEDLAGVLAVARSSVSFRREANHALDYESKNQG